MKTPILAALFVASAIGSAAAQGPRPFHDSWFWGVSGGVGTFSPVDRFDPTLPVSTKAAAEVGIDWLITRTNGGLYASFSRSFVSGTGAILNGPTSADTGFRFVDVGSVRRFNLGVVGFPGDWVRFHPYVGAGIAFDYIADTDPLFGPTDTQKQVDFAVSEINDLKAALGPMFIAGAQYRFRGVSAFGQFVTNSRPKDFLLSNGRTIAVSFNLGVRYNIGSSIEHNY